MAKKIELTTPPYRRAVIFYGVLQFIIALGLLNTNSEWFFFWYCYHIPLFYAIAFWRHKPQVIFGLMHVGLMVQLTWIFDLFAHLIGRNISDQTTFLFEPGPLVFKIVSLVTHILVPFTVLIWTYNVKPERKSLYYSFAYIIFLYASTLIFTPPEQDLNCVYSICSVWVPTWHYTLMWPLYLIIMAASTYGLHRLVYWYFKKAVKAL